MSEADRYEVLEKIGECSGNLLSNASDNIKATAPLESLEKCAASQTVRSFAVKRLTMSACRQKKGSSSMLNSLSSLLFGIRISSDTSIESI